MLTIEQIRAAAQRVPVEMPEFGVTVYAVSFKAFDRMEIAAANTKPDGSVEPRGFMCATLAATIRDEAGDSWLTPEVAGELSDACFQRLYEATGRLNGLVGAPEDAAKNSDAAPSGDSPSVSP